MVSRTGARGRRRGPSTSCTSPSSWGTTTGRRSPVSLAQPLDRRGVARRRARAPRPRCARPSPRAPRRAARAARPATRVRRPAPASRSGCTRLTIRPPKGMPRVAQLAAEEDRLLDRLALGRGDDEERRRRVGEQRLDALGALPEAVDEPAERAEEHAEVVEQVDAGQPLRTEKTTLVAAADDLRGQPRRGEEDPQRAPLEEAASGGRGRRGSPARCATAGCRGRARRSARSGRARRAWPPR